MTPVRSILRGRVAALLALAALLLSVAAGCAVTTPPETSAARDAVAAATAKWAVVFVVDNPAEIVALYDDDAILWGTLSPTLAEGRQAIGWYFERAYKALPGHSVKFGQQKIRVYGDIAINSGFYTFSYLRDGETVSLPARYSFVYRKRGNDWLIVDHHSSALPPPPR